MLFITVYTGHKTHGYVTSDVCAVISMGVTEYMY